MIEKTGKEDELTGTLSELPIGSPESRAAARFVLEDRSRPPHVVVVFVNPEHDKATGAVRPVACDSRTAHVAGKVLTREPGESLADFTSRVADELPATGAPHDAIMWPAEEGDEKPIEKPSAVAIRTTAGPAPSRAELKVNR